MPAAAGRPAGLSGPGRHAAARPTDFPQVNPGFPHDSTGDQFFNAAQFDSYQELGYLIGQVAVDRLFEVNTGLSRLGRSNRTPY